MATGNQEATTEEESSQTPEMASQHKGSPAQPMGVTDVLTKEWGYKLGAFSPLKSESRLACIGKEVAVSSSYIGSIYITTIMTRSPKSRTFSISMVQFKLEDIPISRKLSSHQRRIS